MFVVLYANGAPDTIRTCDLHLRRVALYPAELRALLLTQCLRGFLASGKEQKEISQVSEFWSAFNSVSSPAHLTPAFGGQRSIQLSYGCSEGFI